MGIVALCLGAPAQAMSIGECAAVEEQFYTLLDQHFDLEVTRAPRARAGIMSGWCFITELAIFHGPSGLFFEADSLEFGGRGYHDWLSGEAVLPREVGLRVVGLDLADAQRFAEPPAAWIAALETGPATLSLALRWDEAGQVLDVERVQLRIPEAADLSVSFSGHAAGAWQPYDIDPAAFALKALFVGFSVPQTPQHIIDIVAATGAPGLAGLPFDTALGMISASRPAQPRFPLGMSVYEALDQMAAAPQQSARLGLTLTLPQSVPVDAAWAQLLRGVDLAEVFPPGARLEADYVAE